MTVVVTDTGPLLHLFQVGSIDLIANLGEIQMTPQVWSELQRHAPSLCQAGIPPWLRLIKPSANANRQAVKWLQAELLHAGEAQALAYAQEIRADLFLSDDTAARTIGQSLGLQVRGSLGVVLYLAATGILNRERAARVLDDLEHHSTLWMSAKVRNAAHQALNQIFDQ